MPSVKEVSDERDCISVCGPKRRQNLRADEQLNPGSVSELA